jgi:hypothetical protein
MANIAVSAVDARQASVNLFIRFSLPRVYLLLLGTTPKNRRLFSSRFASPRADQLEAFQGWKS